MSITKQVTVSILVVAIVLFLGMLFWPFLVTSVIKPTALVLWLLLRVLVLSIHQKFFWYGVIAAACIILFRILPRGHSEDQPDSYLETNTTILNISYWRVLFTYNGQNIQEDKPLRRELTPLLTSLYASKQRTSNDFRLHEALEQGAIPLPDNIHTFLFSQAQPISGGPIRAFFQSIRYSLRKRIRQWTGQEETEHYKTIDEILSFLENSLEINNDEKKLSQDQH